MKKRKGKGVWSDAHIYMTTKTFSHEVAVRYLFCFRFIKFLFVHLVRLSIFNKIILFIKKNIKNTLKTTNKNKNEHKKGISFLV